MPYDILWCKRRRNPEDPWISATDHHNPPGGMAVQNTDDHSMLYGEAFGMNNWDYFVLNRQGANVWVR